MTEQRKKWDRVAIGNASIDCITYAQATRYVLEEARARQTLTVVTPNVDHVVQLETDQSLQQVYRHASLVVCDGMPLVWASKMLGTPLPERVTGADLMPGLCKLGAALGMKVAIVGGPPGSADIAAKRLTEAYPGLEVVWTYCPPLGFERDRGESKKIVDELNRTSPDLVFLGVGAPKQELWIDAHQSQLKVGAILGVGAAIEFCAGQIPRAPKFLRKIGLEWAYRLAMDPKRLAKRYFRDLRFVEIVGRQWLRLRINRR